MKLINDKYAYPDSPTPPPRIMTDEIRNTERWLPLIDAICSRKIGPQLTPLHIQPFIAYVHSEGYTHYNYADTVYVILFSRKNWKNGKTFANENSPE